MKLTLFVLALVLTGCAHGGSVVTSDKDAWINISDGLLLKEQYLFWCEAHPKPGGDPAPACYAPKYMQLPATDSK